jgi:hypothetical protein
MTSTAALSMRPSRTVAIGALVWLALALILGASGALATLAPPGPQLIILSLVVITVVLGTAVPAVRAWVDAIPIRTLVGINAARFIGIVFLVLGARGVLSPLFAARAGWGDIAAALVAIVLVLSGDPVTRGRRAAYLAWNVFGLADLIVAVSTATWVALRGLTPGMDPILHLPLSLVPTFAVPVLVANHVFLFRRLRSAAAVR